MTKKILRASINLKGVSPYIEGELDARILQGLADARLLSKDFLYSFFDLRNLKRVQNSGTTRDSRDNVIYAFKRDQLVWESDRPNCSIKDRVKEDLNPAIAVFDRQYLKPAILAESSFGYSFKDSSKRTEALVGIAKLLM